MSGISDEKDIEMEIEDEPLFKQPLPSAIFSNIVMPMVGANCEVISHEGKRCSETFSFTNVKERPNDCSKYCLEHTYQWLNSVFNNKYDVYFQNNILYSSDIEVIELYIKTKIKLPKGCFKTTNNIYYYIQNLDYNQYYIYIYNDFEYFRLEMKRRRKNINNIVVANYLYELFKTNELNTVFEIKFVLEGDVEYIRKIIVKYHNTNKISNNWIVKDGNIIKYIYKIKLPEDSDTDYDSNEIVNLFNI